MVLGEVGSLGAGADAPAASVGGGCFKNKETKPKDASGLSPEY